MNIFSKEALQSPITIFLIAGENKITKWEPKSGSPREPCFTAGNGTLKQTHRAIESSNALFRKKCSSWGVKTSGVHQRRGSTGSDHLVIITIRFEDMKQPYILFVSFIITVVILVTEDGQTTASAIALLHKATIAMAVAVCRQDAKQAQGELLLIACNYLCCFLRGNGTTLSLLLAKCP